MTVRAIFLFVLATRQEFSFGKTYAAYGGIFIAMAVLWGWFIDKRFPDSSEWLGAGICLVGVAVMLMKGSPLLHIALIYNNMMT